MSKDGECAALHNFSSKCRKIIGIGLNYKECFKHNGTPPKTPIIFLKAPSSIITEGQDIEMRNNNNVIEEVELGVIIGKKGKNISESEAFNYIGGYCLALDMTELNEMKHAKENGLSWTIGKGFDTACPVSQFISNKELTDPENTRLWCKINGNMVQDSTTSDLLFPIPKLISYISRYMTLEPYDLILTGTPPGSVAVKPGDKIEAGLGDVLNIKFSVEDCDCQ